MPHHLVGVAEVADMLGLTRQRVHQLAQDENADFPKPAAVLSAGVIWERKSVEEWAKRSGRLAQDFKMRHDT